LCLEILVGGGGDRLSVIHCLIGLGGLRILHEMDLKMKLINNSRKGSTIIRKEGYQMKGTIARTLMRALDYLATELYY